jgi:hypothetical protein
MLMEVTLMLLLMITMSMVVHAHECPWLCYGRLNLLADGGNFIRYR